MEVTPLLPHQSPAHPLALQDPLKHKICLKRTTLIGISLLLLLIIIFESSKFAITFRFPAKLANEAASLKSIRFSYEGVGTVKVIAVRGKDMKYTMLEAEYITTDWTRLFGTTMDALVVQADPTSIRFMAKFPPLNTLFSPRITVTIYAYLPLELENLSIQGEDIDVIYMGPNVSKTLSVKVQRGTIQILTPISLVNVALSTTKGTLRIENANATTFELAALDLSSSVSVTGRIGGFKSAVITTKSASVNMFLYPDVSASVKMKSIKGSYKLGTYGFKGNVSFSSQRHAGLFDGIDWPLLGILPTRATVGGKDGRGVMSIETQQAILLVVILLYEPSKYMIMFRYYGRIQNKAEALKAVYFTSEGAGTVKIIVLRGTQPQSAVLVSEYASTDWTRLYQTNIETTLDEDDPTVCRFRVQFAPLNRGFNPNIKLTIYAYLPLELKNVSIQGSYIDLMYLGPNVADTLNVEVQQGSVRILTPILAKRITLSTTKGNLKMDNVHATTIHIKSLDQDSVGTISGTIGGFNSAILETRSGDIRAILNPIANASIFMRSISGSYYLTTYGFKGNLTFSSQVHPGLFDGIDFPLLGLFPTRATVGGKDGKGIMYVETQTGLGQLFFKE